MRNYRVWTDGNLPSKGGLRRDKKKEPLMGKQSGAKTGNEGVGVSMSEERPGGGSVNERG